jgi:multimeric flavodoxin WrbA
MKKFKKLIINGSARKNGHSGIISKFISNDLNAEVIHLVDYKIGQFDYEFKNQDDDFLPLMNRIIGNYDSIIFITPVYWYTMSGHLKVFFDRMSDLLKIKKELGRKLRGKSMSVISNSGADDLVNGFFEPFKSSANYLGMQYLGDCHILIDKFELGLEAQERLKTFITIIP